MNYQSVSAANLQQVMDTLAGKNGAARMKARKSLVALGKPAVSSLIRLLQNSDSEHVRWEAAKTLGAIGDIRALRPLVQALEDNNPDVTWVAAEALRKFKKAAWPSLLRALIKSKPESVLLRKGAHHVLGNQKEDGFNDLLAALRIALNSSTASELTPFVAFKILKRLKAKS